MIPIGLSIIFLILTYFVIKENISWYDDFIINIVRDITDFKTSFYKVITFFGEIYFFIAIVVILFIVLKNKKDAIFISINLILAAFINNVLLKSLIARERPADMLIEQGGYSFPSGHSFVSAAFYGFLIYLICTSKIQKKYKIVISSILSLLILLIGISRIYLGVHFPSDVTAGLIGGVIFLIIFIEIISISKGVVYEKKEER